MINTDLFYRAEQQLLDSLNSRIQIAQDVSSHIVTAGGKRLRQKLCLIAGKLLRAPENILIDLANALEILHTATLLHDDVIDSASVRRNVISVNAKWSNSHGILGGDFLYSRAFTLISSLEQKQIIQTLAKITTQLVEAEFVQLIGKQSSQMSVDDYLYVINGKTANLLSFCCYSPCFLISPTENNQINQISMLLQSVGNALGQAFQVNDDLHDYISSVQITGKNKFQDFNEGLVTLPLIYALHNITPNEKNIILSCLGKSELSTQQESDILNILYSSSAVSKTEQFIQNQLTLVEQGFQELQNMNVDKEQLETLYDVFMQLAPKKSNS